MFVGPVNGADGGSQKIRELLPIWRFPVFHRMYSRSGISSIGFGAEHGAINDGCQSDILICADLDDFTA